MRLAISGATYPGVPHLGKGYVAAVYHVANPKSTILNPFISFCFLNIMFSGFKSLCIIFKECMWETAVKIASENKLKLLQTW